MSMSKVGLIALCIFASIVIPATASDESPTAHKVAVGGGPFLVSGKLPGMNDQPALAVNSSTGDVLVVWSQMQTDSVGVWQKAVIYAVLCERMPNDVYKIGRARAISGTSGLNMDPGVAYNPEENDYVVVWSYSNSVHSAELRARSVDEKGKPGGQPIILTSASKENRQPQINFISLAAAAPRDFATYLVVWDKRSDNYYSPDGSAGIYMITLDKLGNPDSSAKQLVPAQFTTDDFNTIFEMIQMIQAGNGMFYLAAGRMIDWPIYEAWVYTINPTGKLEKSRKLAGVSSLPSGIAQIANKLLLVAYEQEDPDTFFVSVYNQRVKSKLGFKGGRYEPTTTYFIDSRACLATLGENGPAFQFGFDYEKFYGWEINGKGDVVGDPIAFFDHSEQGYYMDNFVVAPLGSGSNEVFVAWFNQLADHEGELWCCVFKAQ
jgi:hypothetical protein